MVQAPGIRVPSKEAEATRRRLADEGRLRADLHPLSMDDDIVFAVDDAADSFDFRERTVRAASYADLLSSDLQESAPRAFDTFGDIAVIKVPDALWDRRTELGEALQEFLGVRAVFHDGGVKGEFRVRDLERIAGDGGSETTVMENGTILHVDVGQAYFSPRLATERARVVAQVRPGEHVVDLFGGVAPFGVQAAKRGARVSSIDLNPAAHGFAERNAAANHVDLDLYCGDARVVAATLDPADRVVMNLPHGAKEFLDVAAALVRPGGVVHYHEILPDDAKDARAAAVAAVLGGRIVGTRHVRNYAKSESHWVFDIHVEGA